MHPRQVDLVFENVLNTLFQVVAVYACERLKVQKKYHEVYWWFERRNKVVEEEIRCFLGKKGLIASVAITKESIGSQEYLDIDDAVYKITQYYWDSYQYHDVTYADELFEKINLKKEDLILFLNQLSLQIRNSFRMDYIERTEFSERYVFSAFVEKDRLIKTLFKYFQIIYEIKYSEISLSPTKLPLKFLELIKIVPYYSIFSKSSIATSSFYPTEMGDKQYAKLYVPFNFQKGALVDNMIHFIFQHLCDLFKYDFTQEKPSNFDLWRYHKAEYLSQIEADSEPSPDLLGDYDYSLDEHEHYARLNECVNIIKSLLSGLPKEQSRIFDSCKNTAMMEPLLLSIIYADFIQQYDVEHAKENLDSDLRETYALPLAHNSEKLKSFFKYLKKGFEDIGFQPELVIQKNADACLITLKHNGKILPNLSNKFMNGNNIRSRFNKHINFFNYE